MSSFIHLVPQYMFMFIFYFFFFDFQSGKLLKAEYILSSLINDNGATGLCKFIFQFHTCNFGVILDPNFNSYTSQNQPSNDSLHHTSLSFTIPS